MSKNTHRKVCTYVWTCLVYINQIYAAYGQTYMLGPLMITQIDPCIQMDLEVYVYRERDGRMERYGWLVLCIYIYMCAYSAYNIMVYIKMHVKMLSQWAWAGIDGLSAT